MRKLQYKGGINENSIKAYGFAFEGKNVLILDLHDYNKERYIIMEQKQSEKKH